MEVIAFLLLGLIAMLAIVPPIIRGKMEESPLISTRNFKKSMLEMAASVDPAHYRKELLSHKRSLFFSSPFIHGSGFPGPRITNNRASYYRLHPSAVGHGYRIYKTSAVTRRRRVYFILGTSALLSGLFALIFQNAVSVGFFATFSVLLLIYIGLVFIFAR